MSLFSAAKALLYEKGSDTGIVGSIYKIEQDKGSVFVTDVMIPIVDYSSNITSPVWNTHGQSDGSYFMQIMLPDGDIQIESFELVNGEARELIFRLPHQGQQEWTNLHAMAGQATQWTRKPTPPYTKPPQSSKYYYQLRDDPDDGYSLSYVRSNADQHVSRILGRNSVNNIATLINQKDGADVALDSFGHVDLIEESLEENDRLVKFDFVHKGLLGGKNQREHYYFDQDSQVDRTYLIQKTAKSSILISLPTPWMAEGEEVEISLMVNKNHIQDKLEYSLAVTDPVINNALGYINAGAFHQATKLFNARLAERMLFQKRSGPLTAVIGGYLLVMGRNINAYNQQRDKWKRWVRNLDNWFNWLPDGAILNSSLFFILGEGSREDALKSLMRAYDRGLPYFTFGLKLMLDGMRYFANEGEQVAQERLKQLQVIADRTDPSQPFLSIEYARESDNTQTPLVESAHA